MPSVMVSDTVVNNQHMAVMFKNAPLTDKAVPGLLRLLNFAVGTYLLIRLVLDALE